MVYGHKSNCGIKVYQFLWRMGINVPIGAGICDERGLIEGWRTLFHTNGTIELSVWSAGKKINESNGTIHV
jgi:hypothetical protein